MEEKKENTEVEPERAVKGAINYFEQLTKVAGDVKKKGNLNYISWADAWEKLKIHHPSANYDIHCNEETGMPYFSDKTGAFVKVSVDVDVGKDIVNHTVMLPVMDYQNKAITQDKLTAFEINKAIQRALTKAIAMHGLGLYVYRGEDIPEGSDTPKTPENASDKKSDPPLVCSECGNDISSNVAEYSTRKFNTPLCLVCQDKRK